MLRVAAGRERVIASLRIEVLAPVRKYRAQNDGSVVLFVSAGRTVFIGGDVEAVAQRDIPAVHPDVLIVPHHGSGTTDLRWLAETIGPVAVLSYGENRYGHPDPEVLAVLADAGAEARHTFIEGDISIGLGSPP